MKFETYRDTYVDGDFSPSEGVTYSMKKQLEKNVRAIHGQFKLKKGQKFYNYVLAFINMLYRQTDWDVKDLHTVDLNGKYPHIVNIVKLATRTYLKDIEFEPTLNKFRKELIGMGHLIIKMGDEPRIVNPLNVIIPPDSAGIQETGMIEIKYVTMEYLEKYKEKLDKKTWEQIEKLYKTKEKVGELFFTVMDYWHYGEFDGKRQKGVTRYLDPDFVETDRKNKEVRAGIELDKFRTPYKDSKGKRIYPFIDSRFIEVPGRYWGAGVAEILTPLTVYSNKILNIKEAFDELQLRGILVHTKADVHNAKPLSQEFLKNIDTGTSVELNAEEKLERLNLGSTTFETLQMLDKLFELMRVFIGINQQATGEHNPSTVTATVGRINDASAKTTYEVVKEIQAIYLTKLFRDFLNKEIIEGITKEDVVALIGSTEELREIDRFVITQMVYREAHEAPTQPLKQEVNAEIDRRMKELQIHGDTRFVEGIKALVKDVKFIFEVQVGDQDMERQNKIVSLLQMAQDPNYTGSKQALYADIRDLLGLTGFKYDKSPDEIEAEAQQMQAEQIAQNPELAMSPEQMQGNRIGNQQV